MDEQPKDRSNAESEIKWDQESDKRLRALIEAPNVGIIAQLRMLRGSIDGMIKALEEATQ